MKIVFVLHVAFVVGSYAAPRWKVLPALLVLSLCQLGCERVNSGNEQGGNLRSVKSSPARSERFGPNLPWCKFTLLVNLNETTLDEAWSEVRYLVKHYGRLNVAIFSEKPLQWRFTPTSGPNGEELIPIYGEKRKLLYLKAKGSETMLFPRTITAIKPPKDQDVSDMCTMNEQRDAQRNLVVSNALGRNVEVHPFHLDLEREEYKKAMKAITQNQGIQEMEQLRQNIVIHGEQIRNVPYRIEISYDHGKTFTEWTPEDK